MKKVYKDVVIIGAGVAGLRAAIALEDTGEIVILAKDELIESSSEYAQGGIAVALSDEDTVGIHFQDTINAGDGLCDEEAVKILVEEGPPRITELIEWGTTFDKEGTRLAFTREAAHSRNRILHAHGDSTGKEIVRALLARTKHIKNLQFLPKHHTLRLILSDDNRASGVLCIDEENHEIKLIHTRAILLATGGNGRVYSVTTNPALATGDGIAYAFEVGAEMMDMEFVQFHPTMLYLRNAPPFLLSEALRGEGAHLVNMKGERFMHKYHHMGELAPRDIVSRAITDEIIATRSHFVFLDMRHLDSDFLRVRFPKIYHSCLAYDFDITKHLVPVHPSAHYFMGGVKTDLHSRTSVRGLYAAGEVACNGVHGANRLASNSLLDGIVYGARAGNAIIQDLDSLPLHNSLDLPPVSDTGIDPPTWIYFQNEIKRIAWHNIGIKRCEHSLLQAITSLNVIEKSFPQEVIPSRLLSESRNLKTVAKLIALFALLRTESRGAHFRTDYLNRDDTHWIHHQSYSKNSIEEILVSIL
ncbi:MAG: L-aspartate oxidase [Candidatus Fischerbacteria bacterium RBG_13_37_8]|uniref:L-aspartate oxidase n=1 Tax=Candidatus Fischerbacteria bacterium RBG_13_37_8 TaxID=1817863 RepID=A0A1F5VG43_9BACT|nr:MAG: L-aspartate oxidase [Candidatus Fischerbacteria bacterium RBG_13_37_8]